MRKLVRVNGSMMRERWRKQVTYWATLEELQVD